MIVLVKGTDQTVTVEVAGAARYRLPGDDDGLGRTTSFEITGSITLIGDSSDWLVIGATNHEAIWQADVDANGRAVFGNTVKQENAIGSMAGAASGRTIFLTGDLADVPVTAGWHQVMRNSSGSDRTITPASGQCITTKNGATALSVILADKKACFVEGDGVNLWVDGDVS